MLFQRVLTSILALLFLIPVLLFGGVWGASALFAVISGYSLYEMASCCGLFKKWYISLPTIAVSAITVILPAVFRNRIMLAVPVILVIIAVSLMYFFFIGVVAHKSVSVERLLMFFALAVYITTGFTALSALSAERSNFGLWAVSFALAVAWATDTFAYFSGRLFGKHKLCPNISPKKTIEGAIGGTVFGTIAGVIVFWIAHRDPIWGLLALPVSIISQFGDLSASIIKRHFGVKDYGNFFPGHGGVLDRFDSIIPSSIASALLLIGAVVISSYITNGVLGF